MNRNSLWIVALLLALLALPAAAQLEEEDLEEPDLWEELRPLYDEAAELLDQGEYEASLAKFDEFLTGIEVNSAFEDPPEEIVDLVVQSRYKKSQARFDLGEDPTEDLLALLALEPSFVMDRGFVSSKLVDRYEELQRENIGRVDIRKDPADATARSGRWEASPEGLLFLPVGTHRILVERPGYASLEEEVEVQPDQTTELDVLLERSSAVVTLSTSEEGVEIYLGSDLMGTTQRFEGQDVGRARYVLTDLQLGSYEVDFRKEGFRTQRLQFEVTELTDGQLAPVTLEPTSGTVTLEGVPDSTVIRVNGEIRTSDFAGPTTLELAPGEYLIELEHRSLGLYEARVTVADKDEISLPVRLRPALALLGILGDDETAAEVMLPELQGLLGGLDRWALIDRAHLGADIASAAGVDTTGLRSFAETRQRDAVDWDRLQEVAASRVNASLYLVAVLSNDLLAETAEIFVWPAPPLPSRPDAFQVPTAGLAGNPEMARLDQSVLQELPRLGATIVDSGVNGRPVVMAVNAGGAADRAGLQPGDEFVAFDGVEVSTVAQLNAELSRRVESHARTGQTVSVGLAGAGGERSVDLAIELGHRILSPREAGVLYSAAAVELDREANSPDIATPKWIVDLNLALVFVRGDDEDSLQRLRKVQAPEDSIFGPGTVNYFLGLQLLQAGPQFAENARTYLSNAAAQEGARLFHVDGPFVGPRARARVTRGQ